MKSKLLILGGNAVFLKEIAIFFAIQLTKFSM